MEGKSLEPEYGEAYIIFETYLAESENIDLKNLNVE